MEEKPTLYSTNCPKCVILEKKLKQLNIDFNVNTNVDEMLSLGMESAPALKVGDKLMGFGEAIKWLNERS